MDDFLSFVRTHISGYRACPGQRLADNSVWLAITRIVATMDIRKARDEHGVEITPDPAYHSGTVTCAFCLICCLSVADLCPRS